MLYLIATPIGNLDDLSYRQGKILASSDIILAEDTRSAGILYRRIFSLFPNLPNRSIFPKLISYYKDVEMKKLPEILNYLKQGKIISLISESGMPLISDPGYLLIKAVIKENIPFTVIPGSSAVTTALIYSGLDPSSKNGGFMFLGYFPKNKSAKLQLINQLYRVKDIFPKISFVFFESPKRMVSTLHCLKISNWSGKVVICRELTKKFEEIIRANINELINRKYKGEITVVI